jgi:hypothetical protein
VWVTGELSGQPSQHHLQLFMAQPWFLHRISSCLSSLLGPKLKVDLAFINDSGSVCWNVASLHEIIDLCARVNANLLFPTFILGNHSGTHLTDQQIHSGMQPQNLYHTLMSMFWLTCRTKTLNLTGADTCIPTFVPPVVLEIQVEYLVVICEVEEVFVYVLYSPEVVELSHVSV